MTTRTGVHAITRAEAIFLQATEEETLLQVQEETMAEKETPPAPRNSVSGVKACNTLLFPVLSYYLKVTNNT